MPRRAVYIVVERIADALDFAHQHGLLHRHVKPGNILLENPDSDMYRILLTDFGTARRLDTPSRVVDGDGARRSSRLRRT